MILALALAAGLALAAPPEKLATQGKLLDSGGVPVADGDYGMTFRFYDACVGGNTLLEDYHAAVPVTDGIYSVLLGTGTLTSGVESTLASVFVNHDAVCMGLTIDGDSEMTPRSELVSTGYALRAATADSGPTGGTLVESNADITWTGSHTYETGITMGDLSDLIWPHITGTVPPDSQFRIIKYEGDPPGQDTHPNQELDEQWMICYNCTDEGVFQRDPTQHAWNQKIEATYWDGVRESLEYNWNYTNPFGNRWRPFAFRLFIDGTCSDTLAVCTDDAECNPGATCDGSNRASFAWYTRPVAENKADFELQFGSGEVIYRNAIFGETTFDGARPFKIANQTDIDIDLLAGTSGVSSTASRVLNQFDGSEANVSLLDMFGVRALNNFVGSTDDRSITGKMIAIDARNEVSQTGSGGSVNDLFGIRYKLVPTGQLATVDRSVGVFVDRPNALNGVSPVTFDDHYAIQIGDQLGLGQIGGAAIFIDAQDNTPDPDRGNIEMQGGAWNTGHLVLGNSHLWSDGGSQLRVSNGAPASSGDGSPVHAPVGTTPNWGSVLWSDGNDAALDTGDEVCAAAGMTCKNVFEMGSSSADSCASIQSGTFFMAMCY